MLSKSTLDILETKSAIDEFKNANPFPHLIIDNFFETEIAGIISSEFPKYDEAFLDNYSNEIEEKKLLNHWNKFGPETYKALTYLTSEYFLKKLRQLTNTADLFPDIGLHGGGLHLHKAGGKLNVHLDYSIHPKLGLERKFNILIYLSRDWQQSWGGCLGLYGNESSLKPGDLKTKIEPKFNRMVIFDTTKNSWHGLPEPIICPEGVTRNSLALYFLVRPTANCVPSRKKALFAPAPWQQGDKAVEELIRKRASVATSAKTYEKNKTQTDQNSIPDV